MDTLQGPLPVAGKAEMSIKGTVSNDSFGSFARAFEASQEIVSRRAIRGYFWPVKELLKDEAVPHAQVLSDFIEPIVQRTLAHKRKMREAGMRPSSEHDTFLEYLADNTEGAALSVRCCRAVPDYMNRSQGHSRPATQHPSGRS